MRRSFLTARWEDLVILKYEVEHPRWRIWPTPTATFSGPARLLYGSVFGEIVCGAPRSAFVAEGSPVSVFAGRRIA